jgi:hypothetical protein
LIPLRAGTDFTDGLDVCLIETDFIAFNNNGTVPDCHIQGGVHVIGVFVVSCVLHELEYEMRRFGVQFLGQTKPDGRCCQSYEYHSEKETTYDSSACARLLRRAVIVLAIAGS